MPHFGEIQSLDDLIDVVLAALADGDVLTYDAATEQWINQAIPPGATKEIWVPATIGLAEAAQSKVGDHGGYLVDAGNKEAITEMHIPHDFTAIDEFVVVFIPNVTLTPMNFMVYLDFAANGEAYDTHSWSIVPNVNTVKNKIQELDLSTISPVFSAGDYVGVRFICDLGTNTDALVLGVRLKYT